MMKKLLEDKKLLVLVVLIVALSLGIIFERTYSGLFMILAIMLFGSLSVIWKENNIKIIGLAAIVFLALLNIGINGMKFGIDFSGGTRIPIILEKSVNLETMGELVDTIKKRVSVLGLTEAKVRAIGDSEIYVELPSSDEKQIDIIEQTLSHQGVYLGIVDGKVAISGEDIYPQTIRPATPQELRGADWGVAFSINNNAAKKFADVVKGKQGRPLNMFLDRPTNAAIFVTSNEVFSDPTAAEFSKEEILRSLEDVLEMEDDTIAVYILDDIDLENTTPAKENMTAIISETASQDVTDVLESNGYRIKEVSEQEIRPVYNVYVDRVGQTKKLGLEQWEAVGLLSSPTLNAGVTQGIPNTGYTITGGAANKQEAEANVKKIESILKGGALPVRISLGSKTVLPASLGKEFLNLSLIGIVSALVTISILIGVRYMKTKIILPIIMISISELIILLSLLGSFTIDLAAMAGIIAAIGVSVDAQIVITDEILKKSQLTLEDKIEKAFEIIKTNVIVAIVAMIPLLFSGLVEVIGFAISTILGALLGFLLTRPAYAVIAKYILHEEGQTPVS